MMSSHQGEYWDEEHCGTISFDFSKKRSLHISDFFHHCFLHLNRATHSSIRILTLQITGFSGSQTLESFEDKDIHESFQRGEELLNLILSLKIPMIGFIKGYVCGPLLEPVLFSDFLLAAKGTRISSLILEKGYFPRMAMLSKLLELLGRKKVMEFLLNGLNLTPDAKGSFPLLYQVVDKTRELHNFITYLLGKGDFPVRLIKEISYHGKALSPREAHLIERYNFALCFSDLQFKEKIESFFKERPKS